MSNPRIQDVLLAIMLLSLEVVVGSPLWPDLTGGPLWPEAEMRTSRVLRRAEETVLSSDGKLFQDVWWGTRGVPGTYAPVMLVVVMLSAASLALLIASTVKVRQPGVRLPCSALAPLPLLLTPRPPPATLHVPPSPSPDPDEVEAEKPLSPRCRPHESQSNVMAYALEMAYV